MKENQTVENLKCKNEKGEEITLESLMGKKGLILYFYPKDNTPGCTKQALSFRDHLKEFENLGYNIVGISKDSSKSHQKFIEKQSLNFTLLTDEEKTLCEYFGVWQQKKFMGKEFMGIVRTTFIISNQMNILKIYDNVKVPNHIETLLKDLKALE